MVERPSSGIAGWRGGWIAGIWSEGTRPAHLPAGPVPERWNVKLVLIETPNGQRLTGRVCWAIYFTTDSHFQQSLIQDPRDRIWLHT